MLTYQAPHHGNSIGLAEVLINQPHATESFIIKDIDAASSIHEYLSKFIAPNLRRHHQTQVTQIVNPARVIHSTP